MEPSSLLKVEVNPFKNMTLDTNTSTENAKKLWESVDQLDCPFLNIEKYIKVPITIHTNTVMGFVYN